MTANSQQKATTNSAGVINISAVEENVEKLGKEELAPSAFSFKTVNAWIDQAKVQSIPNRLYGDFWFENELCFLFADANAGKSIKATQIGNGIAAGLSEAPAQKVLYIDFELTAKQFECRYSNNYADHFVFSENFIRAEINTDVIMPERFKNEEEWFDYSFNQLIAATEARIIIVDNITYMRDELEKAKIASQMMKVLKTLKKKFGLSILALGHTPKRDMTRPIRQNDLGGSKMLINFADSSFAIGESAKDSHLRYLKQIKVRNAEKKYTEDNVMVFQIAKDHNFLEFQHIGYSPERDHLKAASDKDKEDVKKRVIELRYQSQREIAARLGISVGLVNKILKAYAEEEAASAESGT